MLASPWLLRVSPAHAVILTAQLSITTVCIVRSIYPMARPVSLVTFVFIFSWLSVAPLYQLAEGQAAWRDDDVLQGRFVTEALILTLAATGILAGGFFWRLRPIRLSAEPCRRWREPSRAVALSYLIACGLLAPAAIAVNGGVANFFTSRTARLEQLSARGLTLDQVGGAQLALVGYLPAALATAAAYLLTTRLKGQATQRGWQRMQFVDVVLAALSLGAVVLFANPLVNTRALSVAALGSLLLIVLRPTRAKAGAIFAVVLLVGTLIVYPWANLLRGSGTNFETGTSALASGDFDGFQQIINALEYIEDSGHTLGLHTMSALLYAIPRSLWEGKAVPVSLLVAEHRGYVFTNLSMPLHGEMYIEFGPIGMVLIVGTLAIMGGRLDAAWTRGDGSVASQLVPYLSLAGLSIIRGPLGANAPVYITAAILILVGLLMGKSSITAKTPELFAPSGSSDDFKQNPRCRLP